MSSGFDPRGPRQASTFSGPRDSARAAQGAHTGPTTIHPPSPSFVNAGRKGRATDINTSRGGLPDNNASTDLETDAEEKIPDYSDYIPKADLFNSGLVRPAGGNANVFWDDDGPSREEKETVLARDNSLGLDNDEGGSTNQQLDINNTKPTEAKESKDNSNADGSGSSCSNAVIGGITAVVAGVVGIGASLVGKGSANRSTDGATEGYSTKTKIGAVLGTGAVLGAGLCALAKYRNRSENVSTDSSGGRDSAAPSKKRKRSATNVADADTKFSFWSFMTTALVIIGVLLVLLLIVLFCCCQAAHDDLPADDNEGPDLELGLGDQ